MRQWTGSSLVQVMACRLFGAKPLPEPILAHCELNSWEHISVKFDSECYHFHSRWRNWKCRLPQWRPSCPGGRWVKACSCVALPYFIWVEVWILNVSMKLIHAYRLWLLQCILGNVSANNIEKTPHSSPVSARLRCLFTVYRLNNGIAFFLLYYVHYRVIFDRDISKVFSIQALFGCKQLPESRLTWLSKEPLKRV